MQDRALNRALIALAAGVFVLLIGFGFWMYGQLGSGDVMSGAFQESEQTRVDIGGAFNLVDHTGRQVTEAEASFLATELEGLRSEIRALKEEIGRGSGNTGP